MKQTPTPNLSTSKGEFLRPLWKPISSGYELHPGIIAMVRAQPFSGLDNENPYQHLQEFKKMCSCLSISGMTRETCRCFLLVDTWLLGNLAWCEEWSQQRHEIYTGLGPREASNSLTSNCYSCIAYIRWDCDYNVAMPMRESMITTRGFASYLYLGSTCPTS